VYIVDEGMRYIFIACYSNKENNKLNPIIRYKANFPNKLIINKVTRSLS